MYFTHFHKNGDVETVWHPSTESYLDYFSGENLPLAAAYLQLHEDVKELVDNLGIAGNMPAGVDHVIDPAVDLRDSIIRFLHAVSKHPHAEDFRSSTLMTPHEPADRDFHVHYDTTKDPLTMYVEVDGEPAGMLHCNVECWFWNADPDGPLAHLRIDPMPADPDKAEWVFQTAINKHLNPHQYSERQDLREPDPPRGACQAPRSLPPFLGKPRAERLE